MRSFRQIAREKTHRKALAEQIDISRSESHFTVFPQSHHCMSMGTPQDRYLRSTAHLISAHDWKAKILGYFFFSEYQSREIEIAAKNMHLRKNEHEMNTCFCKEK